MYRIDLATILRLQEEFHRSGSLTAELPKGIPGWKEHCLAEIELREGRVVMCVICGSDGRYLASGEQALRLLHSLGMLRWQVQLHQRPNSEPLPPEIPLETSPLQPYDRLPSQPLAPIPYVPEISPAFTLIPQRVVLFAQNDLHRLTHRQRRVFVLIDGVRSAAKISAMLFPSSPDAREVMDILSELEAMGLITRSR